MSDYQARKALALKLQQRKEDQFKAELEAKRLKEKQAAKDEAERKNQRDAAAKEARRQELLRANAALHQAPAPVVAREVEWNPFAEDEIRPPAPTFLMAQVKKPKAQTSGSSTKAGNSNGAGRAGRSNVAAKSTSRSAATGAAPRGTTKGSPPPLGRKAKAALAFAQSASKPSKADSIFDLRDLVDPRASSHSPKMSSSAFPHAGPSRIASTLTMKRSNSAMTSNSSSNNHLGPNLGGASKSNGNARPKGKSTDPTGLRHNSAGDPSRSRSRPIPPPGGGGQGRKRAHSEYSDSPDTSSDEGTPPPKRPSHDRPRGKERSERPNQNLNVGLPPQTSISEEIQALFRRPGAPKRHYEDYDSDDLDGSGSDMEAGLSDVEEEERRAARIAKREDEIAEREEAERKRKKEAMKRQREKERKVSG